MRTLPDDYPERAYAAVLGKLIGVYLGRLFEGWTHERVVRLSQPSFSSSARAAGADEAGFCPVMSRPSATTCGCHMPAFE